MWTARPDQSSYAAGQTYADVSGNSHGNDRQYVTSPAGCCCRRGRGMELGFSSGSGSAAIVIRTSREHICARDDLRVTVVGPLQSPSQEISCRALELVGILPLLALGLVPPERPQRSTIRHRYCRSPDRRGSRSSIQSIPRPYHLGAHLLVHAYQSWNSCRPPGQRHRRRNRQRPASNNHASL